MWWLWLHDTALPAYWQAYDLVHVSGMTASYTGSC